MDKRKHVNGVLRMAKLPAWLEEKYEMLFKEFSESEFTHSDAAEVLKGTTLTGDKGVSAVISELKKSGCLKSRRDPSDKRRRLYRLVPKDDIIKNYLEIRKNKIGRGGHRIHTQKGSRPHKDPGGLQLHTDPTLHETSQ